ncbi:hypothetical protein [Kitasatospora sp. NPDC087315]|uniref:hypothetical protein n=1 Tax=Kitasatospora sp. NPDC087315 TaxID=3364069 RepID=UPI00382F3A4B
MAENIGWRMAALELRLQRLESSPRLQHSSIENGAVNVYDGSGSLRAVIGQQGDGTTAVNVTNGPVPPTPAKPAVTPALAALTVSWDGTWQGAVAAPLDFSRVEVHVGTNATFVPSAATLVGTIETPQGGPVTVPLGYAQWWVRLRARTTAGVAGPVTTAVSGTPRRADGPDLEANAINGFTLTGVTVTGSTVQTGTSGRRVTLTPNDPLTGDPNPAVTLYSGAAAEKAPAQFTAAVAPVDDSPATPVTTLSSPRIADTGGTHVSTLLLGGGKPGSAYSGVARFMLRASGATGLNGEASIAGSAGDGDTEGMVRLFVRAKANPAKHGMVYIDPALFQVDLADGSSLSYATGSGLYINSPVKISGGDLTVGPSANIVLGAFSKITNGETWTDITFKPTFGNLGDGTPGSWRKVQVKKQTDGTVALRGVASVPGGFTSGVIGTLPSGYAPVVDEIFRPAAGGAAGVIVFIHRDGRIEVVSSSPISDGFVSLSRCVWDLG